MFIGEVFATKQHRLFVPAGLLQEPRAVLKVSGLHQTARLSKEINGYKIDPSSCATLTEPGMNFTASHEAQASE